MTRQQSSAVGGARTSTDVAWWRRAVVYQVYVRSFADGTGDGIGDLAGLRSRLGYLRDLGIDAIWINPWYPSPLNDGGYDVADYYDIDPRIGTLAEAEALIADAHGHGINVITDVVPNHTSSEHPWFQQALISKSGSDARRRYHFLPGAGSEGEKPPNDWRSVFGGPAWTRTVDGEWYLHLFDASQPDLNWANAEVRREFENILRFWLDRGVDGFRVDVAHGLAKDPAYPDVGPEDATPPQAPDHPFWDREELHDIIRGWRSVLDEYGERMMVAEAWVRRERLARYLRPDEYHQAFDFEFMDSGWDAAGLREAITRSLRTKAAAGSVPTWVLSSHDAVRHATRFGLPSDVDVQSWMLHGPHDLLDARRGLRRARAAALLMLALPGSAYLYQGEELGLPEVWDLPTDVLTDPLWTRSQGMFKGRDGCRVPLPWTENGVSFGFGDAAAWLPQPTGFGAVSVERQTGDPDSTLELHRRALQLRNRYARDDEYLEILDRGDDILAFRRGSGLVCIVNMDASPHRLPPGRVVLASGDVEDALVQPDDAVWLLGRDHRP